MDSIHQFFYITQEICKYIDEARSLEALYENLPVCLAKISDAPASTFLTTAKYDAEGDAFQIIYGTGRYASDAGSIVRDESIRKQLSNAAEQRSNHYDQGAVVFCFPQPENFSVLVYVVSTREIDADAQEMLKFVNNKVTSAIQAHGLSKQAVRTGRAMVIALASLAENKDQDTGEHIMRVAIMTDEIVQVLDDLGYYAEEITPAFRHNISSASILHDVGKIAIPDNILKKPGRLDPKERRIVETHAKAGKEVLERANRILDNDSNLLNLSCDIALYHHEHYDGEGYPTGIAGEKIPLSARIVGVTDVFDALTSVRPYKNAWGEQEAIDYIKEQSGKQFDPKIIDAFLRVMEYRKSVAMIQWTEAMSVKVARMDSDHRSLIGLINQLAAAEKIGNRRVAESVLDALLDYAIDHFDREEQYLQKSGYPSAELAMHKLQHASFAKTIREVRWQYLHGLRPRINKEVLVFLRNWLSKHILVEDMKYAALVQA